MSISSIFVVVFMITMSNGDVKYNLIDDAEFQSYDACMESREDVVKFTQKINPIDITNVKSVYVYCAGGNTYL